MGCFGGVLKNTPFLFYKCLTVFLFSKCMRINLKPALLRLLLKYNCRKTGNPPIIDKGRFAYFPPQKYAIYLCVKAGKTAFTTCDVATSLKILDVLTGLLSRYPC